ncbi:MAG TPA: hypothetical protein VGH77_11350 [Streptosporangiaceae bacterium]
MRTAAVRLRRSTGLGRAAPRTGLFRWPLRGGRLRGDGWRAGLGSGPVPTAAQAAPRPGLLRGRRRIRCASTTTPARRTPGRRRPRRPGPARIPWRAATKLIRRRRRPWTTRHPSPPGIP